MIWLNLVLALISVPFLVIGYVYIGEKKWGEVMAFFSALILVGNLAIIIVEGEGNKPTALDVYRGKTTLEITYRDSVAVDSVVVYKVR